MGEKVRIVYLAYSDLIPYSDPTEPRLYPNKYCPLVEKEHYDAQARTIERLKALVLEAANYVELYKAVFEKRAIPQAEIDWLERASKELGE